MKWWFFFLERERVGLDLRGIKDSFQERERESNKEGRKQNLVPLLSQPYSGFCATRHTFQLEWLPVAVPQPLRRSKT